MESAAKTQFKNSELKFQTQKSQSQIFEKTKTEKTENEKKLDQLQSPENNEFQYKKMTATWVESKKQPTSQKQPTGVSRVKNEDSKKNKKIHSQESDSSQPKVVNKSADIESEVANSQEEKSGFTRSLKLISQSFEKQLRLLERRNVQDKKKIRTLQRKNKRLAKELTNLQKALGDEKSQSLDDSVLDLISEPKSLDEIELIKAKIDQARKDLFVMQSNLEKEVA